MTKAPLIEARNLSKVYGRAPTLVGRGLAALRLASPPRPVRALDGVSFAIARGEVLGVVGESGCGKSTLGRLVAGLTSPSSGEILQEGRPRETTEGLDRQMIFQDPFSSLNPRQRVADLIGEAPSVHRIVSPEGIDDYVAGLMERCGIDRAARERFAHQFSGGQRQRIGIARALALRPQVLVCDEPVSALDVSVQAQVINLLEDLQDEFGLSYLFIAHDLSVVRHLSDQVNVMYLGRIIESGTNAQIYEQPTHPYTQALLSAVPQHDPSLRGSKKRIVLSGDLPSPADPPSGCHFRTRCWKAQDICAVEYPPLIDRGFGHPASCHFQEVIEIVPTHAEDEQIPLPTAPADRSIGPRRSGGPAR